MLDTFYYLLINARHIGTVKPHLQYSNPTKLVSQIPH